MMLSIDTGDCVSESIKKAQRLYTFHKLLLMADDATMPDSWIDLPPTVVGYRARNLSLQCQIASIERALKGDYNTLTSANNDHCMKHCSPLEHTQSGAVYELSDPPSQERTSTRDGVHTADGKVVICEQTATRETRLLHLTPRQYQVLVYLTHGYSNQLISQQLDVSISTIRKHTQEIYARLNVTNRNQAVSTAIASGARMGLMLKFGRMDYSINTFTVLINERY